MKIIHGGVTQAKGFKASGLYCGIKRSGKFDLALITSDVVANAAAVFTINSIKAAPVIVSQKHIQNGKIQAIVANSGNANCFTGNFGYLYAKRTTEIIGKHLRIPKENVLVASTGIIGKILPIKNIQKSAGQLVKSLNYKGGHAAAKAILTTDLATKECAVTTTIEGKKVTVGGCTKGSGMIAPNMATMLAFITTDANISVPLLKAALKEANEDTFNCITVDGCMSTNDMVAVMANGKAGNKKITSRGKDFNNFYKALHAVCLDLAKKIVIDGEGATKFVEIKINGAKDKKQARTIGLAVANSVLVKTAIFGSNPNWGRVAAAVGSVGIKQIDEKNVRIKFSPFDRKYIVITVDLNTGKAKGTVYTSDLSYEYVKINVAYT